MLTSTRLHSFAHQIGWLRCLLALCVVMAAVAVAVANARAQGATVGVQFGLTLSTSTVKGGSPVTGQVIVMARGPFSGGTVTLSSSNTAVATVPASVYLPTSILGRSSATFTVTTYKVTANKSVTIKAVCFGSLSSSKSLTVTP